MRRSINLAFHQPPKTYDLPHPTADEWAAMLRAEIDAQKVNAGLITDLVELSRKLTKQVAGLTLENKELIGKVRSLENVSTVRVEAWANGERVSPDFPMDPRARKR